MQTSTENSTDWQINLETEISISVQNEDRLKISTINPALPTYTSTQSRVQQKCLWCYIAQPLQKMAMAVDPHHFSWFTASIIIISITYVINCAALCAINNIVKSLPVDTLFTLCIYSHSAQALAPNIFCLLAINHNDAILSRTGGIENQSSLVSWNKLFNLLLPELR